MRISESGLAAYVLLYASATTGVLVSFPFLRRSPRIFSRAARAHELLSLAGLFFAILHTLGSVVLPQGTQLALLLFLGPGGRVGLALGTASVYAMVLVTVTFYLRNRIGSPLWRRIHALAYPAFAAAAWHSVTIGANAWLPALRVFYAVTVLSVGLLACGRLIGAVLGSPRAPGPSAALPRS